MLSWPNDIVYLHIWSCLFAWTRRHCFIQGCYVYYAITARLSASRAVHLSLSEDLAVHYIILPEFGNTICVTVRNLGRTSIYVIKCHCNDPDKALWTNAFCISYIPYIEGIYSQLVIGWYKTTSLPQKSLARNTAYHTPDNYTLNVLLYQIEQKTTSPYSLMEEIYGLDNSSLSFICSIEFEHLWSLLESIRDVLKWYIAS